MPLAVKSPPIDFRRGYSARCVTSRRLSTASFSFPCVAAVASSPPTTRNSILVLGMGYVGKCFAQDLKRREGGEWVVGGTCTSIMKKRELEDMGFGIHLFDANEPDPEILDMMNHHTHILVSIPPTLGVGDPMLQYKESLRTGLMKGNLKWLCYLSSTSVYGDCGGQWVDEDYLVAPTDEKAKARLAAEKGWLKLGNDLGISTQILRLGGIYGHGRSAVNTLVKDKPMSETQRLRVSKYYTSRVHVADICQVLRATIDKPSFGKVYNVVDDDPAPRAEVFSYARDLIDRKWPGQLKQKFESQDEPQVQSLYDTSYTGKKRVANERIKSELGVRLLYPNFKSGLKSIVEHMDNPFL